MKRKAKQKIFGLGYNLLVFVYDKKDDPLSKTAILDFVSCSFVEKERTGDYKITFYLREMLKYEAIQEEIAGYLNDIYISHDEETLIQLAEEIIQKPPKQGYLTGSYSIQRQNCLQKVIELDKEIEGIIPVLRKKRA